MKNYINIDGKKIAIVDIVKELEALRASPKEDTLEDVLKRLPANKGYYIGGVSDIRETSSDYFRHDINHQNILNTELRAKQLQAITLLMNVADALNEGQEDCEWYMYYATMSINKDEVVFSSYYKNNFAYFKTRELAEKAAKLLGNDMIKLIYTGEE